MCVEDYREIQLQKKNTVIKMNYSRKLQTKKNIRKKTVEDAIQHC